jgi:deoxyribodipyrimidine photo-lyase
MQAGIVGINVIRVYSPTKQIMDQDPHCTFIKKWIPELRSFTPEEILQYETINLGTYPAPIVDFKINSKAMKDHVFTIRKSTVGKSNSAQVLNQHGSRKSFKKQSSPKKKKSESILKEDNQLKLF